MRNPKPVGPDTCYSFVDGKGRTTIPAAVRHHLGLVSGDRVKLIPLADGRYRVTRVDPLYEEAIRVLATLGGTAPGIADVPRRRPDGVE